MVNFSMDDVVKYSWVVGGVRRNSVGERSVVQDKNIHNTGKNNRSVIIQAYKGSFLSVSRNTPCSLRSQHII